MLTVSSFKEVATGFKTHKELHDTDSVDLLTDEEIEDLSRRYSCVVDEETFRQILVVRKRHRVYVKEMLSEMVAFRKANDWPLLIRETDLQDDVRVSTAYSIGVTDDMMPLIYMKLRMMDVNVASPKDFQLQGQYAIQEASKLSQDGEIAVTLDLKDSCFAMWTQWSQHDLRRGLDIFCKFPVKVKRVYVVNESRGIRFIMKAVLSLASNNVQSKVVFAGW